MEIEQNWSYSGLELYLLKDLIKPLVGLYVLAGLNGDALEFETGGFMEKKLKEVYYTLDPSAFPSYNYHNLNADQALSERITIRKMYFDFEKLEALWLSSKRENEFESPTYMIEWALSKKYRPKWLDWSIERGLYVPERQSVQKAEDSKKETERSIYASTCRRYAQEYIDSQAEMPRMKAIALAVHLRLKEEKLCATRGDYWSVETITREALVGITGRKANGKK